MFTFNQIQNPIYHENNNKFMLQLGEEMSELAIASTGFGYQEGCTYFPVVSYSGLEPACNTPLIHFSIPADRVFFESNPEGAPSVLFLIHGQWHRVKNRQVGVTFCVEFLAHFSALCYELNPVEWERNARDILVQRIRIAESRVAQTIHYARANPIGFYRKLTEREHVPLDQLIDGYMRDQAYLVMLSVHQIATQPTLVIIPGYTTPYPRDFLDGAIREEIVNSYLNTAPLEFGQPLRYRELLETETEFRKWAIGFYMAVQESSYVCDQIKVMYEPLGGDPSGYATRPLSVESSTILCGIYYTLRDLTSIPALDCDSMDGRDYLWLLLGQPKQVDVDWLLASAHGRFAFRYRGVTTLDVDYFLDPTQEAELSGLYVAGNWTELASRYDELLRAK